MSIAQEETPMSDQQPDMIAQAGDLLKRYQSGLYDPARDTTVVLASAVLAVAAELRDIHNVVHEINQRMESVDSLASMAENVAIWGTGS